MSEDNGEREGGAGRSPRRGRGLVPSDPARDWTPGFFPAATPGPRPSVLCPQRSLTPLSPGSPFLKNPGVQTPTPARRPRAAARDSGPSRDLGEEAAAARSRARPSHLLPLLPTLWPPGPALGQPLLLWGPGQPPGSGREGGSWGGRRQEGHSEVSSFGRSLHSWSPCPLFLARVFHGSHGLPQGNWGMWKKGSGLLWEGGGGSTQSSRRLAVARGRCGCPDSSLIRPGSGFPSFLTSTLQLETH